MKRASAAAVAVAAKPELEQAPLEEEEQEEQAEQAGQREHDGGSGAEQPESEGQEAEPAGIAGSAGKGKHKKVISEQKLKRLKEEYDRKGVVYISRIPPHMKPMKLKQLLSAYGETQRVYCAPEDSRLRRLRKQKGGNTGKNFTEGWVEFSDKRVAKRVAVMLNGQRIGGKRRSAYYDDLWVIKYLKHFKWDHLTEEVAYQHAVREQRLATEISAAKRERDHYLAQVDRSKALTAMSERRAAKAAQAGEAGSNTAAGAGAGSEDPGASKGRKRAAAAAAQASLSLQGAGHASGAGVSAGHGKGGAEAGKALLEGGTVVRNKGLRMRQPLPLQPGEAAGREVADDVLMMIARKKPRLQE